MPEKTIKELESDFEQLHEQLLRGELEEDDFKAEVEQLRYKDDLGRQWKIGWYTGKWYRHDQGQWVQGTPLERQDIDEPATATPLPAEAGQRRRPVTYWLVGALVVLLLVASVVLVVGWNTDWWSGSPAPIAEVTATEAASPTPPPASPTSRPATVVPSPTATIEPTATPRPQPTSQPTATTAPTSNTDSEVTATTTAANTPTSTSTSSPTASPVPSRTAPAASTAAPARASLSGRIYFPVYDPDPARRTFDIYAVRLADGEREIVVGQASQPAISPDGERLAHRSWDRDQRGLSVLELTDGHSWRWIEFSEAARPSWSPDSQNIVFPSRQESDRRWRVYRTIGLEFTLIRRHGGDIFGRVPIWLSDGRIVYWDCPLDKCGLYVMKSDGTGLVRLTTAEHDTGPAASPDGRQVAFMSNRSGNWEVYIVDSNAAEGTEPTRLTQNAARDGLPAWSPDGKWVAFVSDRDGAWAVWAVRPNGSGLQKLFAFGGPLEGEVAYAQPGEQEDWTSETIAWGP
jgi:TolB protein